MAGSGHTTKSGGFDSTSNVIAESEPNDTLATANPLLGNTNDLIALGGIGTDSDIDIFKFLVTSPGSVQINGFGLASGGGTLDNIILIGLDSQDKILGLDFGSGVHDGQLTLNDLTDGTYYAAIASGDNPNGTLTGTYRLEVQGINGGIVAGFAPVPETSSFVSFGLMLALGFGSVAITRRKRIRSTK